MVEHDSAHQWPSAEVVQEAAAIKLLTFCNKLNRLPALR